MAQNKVNGDLYIVDKEKLYTDYGGKVIALDMNYTFRYEFTGHGDDSEIFSPYGLCTDNSGRVFITDCMNDKVHILDKNGRFLQYLLTSAQGLRKPYNIDVDNAGNVWIANLNGRVTVYRYL